MTLYYLILSFLIAGAAFVNRDRRVHSWLAGAFLLQHTTFAILEATRLDIPESGYFQPDALAVLMLLTLTVVAIPAFYHSNIFIEKHNENPRERAIYYGSLMLLIVAMSCAFLANHIGVTWVFVEMTTLTASALIYHRRNAKTLEATWKYVFICSISISMVFIGILLLSLALREVGEAELTYDALIEVAPRLDPFWLQLAFVFIFTGFTAKLGLVPMFNTGIDAKDKAPSPAGALLSSSLMNVGFVGVFRFYEIVAQTTTLPWASGIITLAALFSIFVAAVYMRSVMNMKRMFAYSSVEHAGVAMLGLAAGGVGYYAAILHMILHSLAKSSLFFQMGQVFRTYQSKDMNDMGSYFQFNKAGALVLLLAFFIVTAMPPSGMFISEFMVFRSLFEAHRIWILGIALLLLTIIIWAFATRLFAVLFTPPVNKRELPVERIGGIESLSQYILLVLVIVLGIFPPQQMVELIQQAVERFPK
ncbi:MAG: hypothetical protein D6816_10280 [Bacteroidetes bacterium]|nr:MAG: hypothetical protein D6816_10280 [Bacteroidota bacterium]